MNCSICWEKNNVCQGLQENNISEIQPGNGIDKKWRWIDRLANERSKLSKTEIADCLKCKLSVAEHCVDGSKAHRPQNSLNEKCEIHTHTHTHTYTLSHYCSIWNSFPTPPLHKVSHLFLALCLGSIRKLNENSFQTPLVVKTYFSEYVYPCTTLI